MAHYIDKDRVVAEIEKLYDGDYKYLPSDSAESVADFKDDLLMTLDTLEAKDVDLDKELKEDWLFVDKTEVDCLECMCLTEDTFVSLAKKYFQLGLQARAGKELVEEVYAHIDGIKNTADRMTSGNFMHHRAAIKFSANTIAKVLELMGIKD